MWLAEFLETHKERCSHEGDQPINRGGNFPVFLRRERDSNPRNPLGVYTLSRRASSTTRASLQGFVEIGCKGIDFF